MKSNDRIYAMKTLNKWEMLKRAEVSPFKRCLVFLVNFHPSIGSASVSWKLNDRVSCISCRRLLHS